MVIGFGNLVLKDGKPSPTVMTSWEILHMDTVGSIRHTEITWIGSDMQMRSHHIGTFIKNAGTPKRRSQSVNHKD